MEKSFGKKCLIDLVKLTIHPKKMVPAHLFIDELRIIHNSHKLKEAVTYKLSFLTPGKYRKRLHCVPHDVLIMRYIRNL